MICAMIARRRAVPALAVVALVAMALAAVAALAGCSSTTKGTGQHVSAAATSSSAAQSSSAPASESLTPTPTTSAATSSSASVQPPPSHPVRTATVHAISGGKAYVIDIWAETTDLDCAAHAYGGPVIAYLTAHPCRGLTRLLATTMVNGKRVGFNQSSLAFAGGAPASYTTAGNFRSLVVKDGTGNVNDLLREGRRLPSGPTSVPSPDAFSALSQDASVTIVDAWYLDVPTPDNDPALVRMAQDIYLQY
jgi:hypothetical protein